jgi:hypothetical protein
MSQDSTAVPANETTLQRTNRKISSRSMLIIAMFFSFAAGVETIIGLDRLVRARKDYSWWPFNFALAVGFLVLAIRWAIPLLAIARARNNFDSPQA